MEVQKLAMGISVVLSFTPVFYQFCSSVNLGRDLVRGGYEVLRVSLVVDEDLLDQLRFIGQLFLRLWRMPRFMTVWRRGQLSRADKL